MLSERSFQIYTLPQLPVYNPALPYVISTTFPNSVKVKGKGPNPLRLSDKQQSRRPVYLDTEITDNTLLATQHLSFYREKVKHIGSYLFQFLHFFWSIPDSGLLEEMGVGSWVKKAEGWRSTHWSFPNIPGDAQYSTGNTLDDTVITVYVPGGYWNYWGDHLVKYVAVWPLCSTPDINTK